MAIGHFQFEAIHPFRDGNGRAGRILNILIMIQKHLLEVPILYLSAYIIRQKEDYYYLLNRVTGTDIWEQWIIYILKAIEETSIYTISKIEEIDRLFVNTHNLIINKLPHIRKETIERIFEQPYTSPKRLIDNNVKSLNTAKKYLGQMTELGIMVPQKVGKENIFLNLDLYNLLSEI
jgi:Fic family protein